MSSPGLAAADCGLRGIRTVQGMTHALSARQPVNTATVPHRSPFRYPGGKTWLVPQVRRWMDSRPTKPQVFVEPFAGGGSIGLTVAAENLAERVVLCELDPNVAVVWQVLIHGDAEALARKIEQFQISRENVIAELNRKRRSPVNRAFQTILRNRVQRGGVMAPGAGLMRAGENGKGVASRWYPSTLARRIRDLQTYRARIEFIHGDAFDVMESYRNDPGAVFFIDPPYTAGGKRAGSRLYEQSAIDHVRLFELSASCAGDVLLTYDNSPEVLELARSAGFATKPIAMRSTHNAEMSELLIGRDLSWVA